MKTKMTGLLLQTISTEGGLQRRIRTEAWQHTPYEVYMPVSSRTYRALNGHAWRWGHYAARVVLVIARPGQCPHCPSSGLPKN